MEEQNDETKEETNELINKKQELEDLKNSEISISEKIKAIEDFYLQFEQLRNKIQDGENGLEKIFEKANNFNNEIGKLKDSSQEKFSDIENKTSIAGAKVKEIEDFHKTFTPLCDSIQNEETGLEKIFIDVKSAKDEVYKLKEQIIETKISAQKSKEVIDKWLSYADEKIKTAEFGNRKQALQTESRIWLGISIGSFVLLTFILLTIFGLIKFNWGTFIFGGDGKITSSGSDIIIVINRLLYSIPAIILTIWATGRYSETRKYLEKYAFKQITSAQMQTYAEIMRVGGQTTEKINKFVDESLRIILEKPYENKETEHKIECNLFGHLFSIKNKEEKDQNQNNEKSNPDA